MRGHWIGQTLNLRSALSGLDPEARAKCIQQVALDTDTARNTVHRQLRAIDYIERHARGENLPSEEIRATLLAVERLQRLERVDPVAAARMRRGVLLGTTPQSTLSKVVLSYKPVRLSDYAHTQTAIAYDYFHGKWDTCEYRGSPQMSDEGKILHVDVEMVLKNNEGRVAAFISPTAADRKERQDRTFAEQSIAIIAGKLFYQEVFVLAAKQEREMLIKFLDKHNMTDGFYFMGLRDDLEERAAISQA